MPTDNVLSERDLQEIGFRLELAHVTKVTQKNYDTLVETGETLFKAYKGLVSALQSAREALARHEGLWATDKPYEYSEALDNGCDLTGAWDCFRDAGWTIHERAVLSQIDAVIN